MKRRLVRSEYRRGGAYRSFWLTRGRLIQIKRGREWRWVNLRDLPRTNPAKDDLCIHYPKREVAGLHCERQLDFISAGCHVFRGAAARKIAEAIEAAHLRAGAGRVDP